MWRSPHYKLHPLKKKKVVTFIITPVPLRGKMDDRFLDKYSDATLQNELS